MPEYLNQRVQELEAELAETRLDRDRLDSALKRAYNCLGHLEYGIQEYRRIEQNMQIHVIDERLRRESA